MQKLMPFPDRIAEQNGDYIEAFSKRLLKALGRKEAEQICRENHWVGVQNYIASSKD